MNLHTAEDHGVSHQGVDEKSNPSEKVITMQKESAATALAELDDDDAGLLKMKLLSSRGIHSLSSGDGSRASQPQPKAKAKARTGTGGGKSAIVVAANQRAKTVKDLKSLEVSLKKAKVTAEKVLNEIALDVHAGDQAQVEMDPSLDLLRSRLDLLNAGMNMSEESPQSLKNGNLYSCCLKDPYLKDLRESILTTKEGCLTLGSVNYCRNVLLDIQPNADKVMGIMDNVRNAVSVLKKIAECCQKESDQWVSNVKALQKARDDEKKAHERASAAVALQEKKEAAKEERRQAALEKRKADKERQSAEKSAQEEQKGGDAEDSAKAPRKKQRFTRLDELTEKDPAVLRDLRNASALPTTMIVSEIGAFVREIVSDPCVPCCARMKKGEVKKVLQVTWLVHKFSSRPPRSYGMFLMGCFVLRFSLMLVVVLDQNLIPR